MNDKESYYKTCESCGRPMAYCKGQCRGKTKGCQCKEYCGSTCAAIRPGEPKCPPQAVIPSLTVESVSNLKDLADCFVHVSDINTTFYIDDKHRIMTTWAGLVSVEDYDFAANPLNLRGQIAYDSKNNVAAIYDKQGANYIFQISDINNDYMLLENKPQINGVTLEGNKTSADLGITDAIDDAVAAEKAEREAADEALGDEIDDINDLLVYDDYIPIEFEEVIYTSEANNTHTHSYVSYAIIDKQYRPEIVMSDPSNVNARVLASNVAEREKATVLTNAGLWDDTTSTTNGVLIIDHVTKQANNINDAERDFLCIADNGTLSTLPANMTTTQVENLGFKYVVAGWYKLYENGIDYSASHDITVLNPRTFIAQDGEGNYLVGACGGRSEFDTGMTLANIVDFIRNTLNFNAVFIYNLDGGGSSQLYNRGLRENRKTNREDRACANYLVFRSSDAKTDVLFKSSKVVNDVIQRMNKYNLQTYYENYSTLGSHCHENITINAVSQVRVKNNMAYLNIVFSVNASGVGGYETLFTGMPKYYSNAGLWFPCIFLGSTVDNTKIYNCYLTQNGEINTRFAMPQGQYSMNLSYILPF